MYFTLLMLLREPWNYTSIRTLSTAIQDDFKTSLDTSA